jgi:two-component system chemotaxis response regulator CheB
MILIDKKEFPVILIGSSTGGPAIVESLLKGIDPGKYAVLIAQHMPEGFTSKWAERLNNLTPFNVSEADDGVFIECGKAFVAPGNKHLLLNKDRLALSSDPPVNRFRPSIDVLFESALTHPSEKIYAVILTGMSNDGVRGIVSLKENGSVTIAQDEKTSAVFGMNKEAIDKGGVTYVMSPGEMIEFFNRI